MRKLGAAELEAVGPVQAPEPERVAPRLAVPVMPEQVAPKVVLKVMQEPKEQPVRTNLVSRAV